MRTNLLACLALLTLLAFPALAAEYYVAQGDPAANDGNVGTADKPFKTITAALPKLRAGDTLIIKQGVYRECVHLGRGEGKWGDLKLRGMAAGEPGRPITVVAAKGEKVVVSAGEHITGWKLHKDAIYVKDNWTETTREVFCDGKYLRQIGGDSGRKDLEASWFGKKGKDLGDLEKGSFYLDPKEKKLYVWLPDGSDPAKHEMERTVRPFTVQINSSYITVAGLQMLYGPVGLHGEYNTLVDCYIANSENCNLGVSGKCNNVLNCEINYGGNSGISTWGYGHRIIGGAVRFNNRRLWSRHWHAGGMKNFSSDTLVSHVVAEGNYESPGIWFDGNNTGNTIQSCIVFGNTNGIMYEIGERAIIKNNICYENKSRGIDISNSSYMLIAHNVCYRNGKAGIGVYAGTRRGGVTYEDEETGTIAARCNVVWGNILIDNWYEPLLPEGEVKDGPELIMPHPKYKGNNANVSDYNLFWRSGNRPIRFWYNYKEGGQFDDLKAWQTQTGQDKHSVVAEPLFKDLAKYDFRPVAKSPAIGMVRSRLGIRLDREDKDQHHDAMLTAGPFMADKKLQPPDTRPPRPETLVTIPLNLHSLPRDVSRQLEDLKLEKLDDLKKGFKLQDVPFEMQEQFKAITLDAKHKSASIAVERNVKTLYVAHSLLNAKKGAAVRCKIVREDGMTLELVWKDGAFAQVDDAKSTKTAGAWKSKDGKLEIMLTSWANDNEWYPVRELQWTLEDEAATVMIFGITAK